MTDPKINPNEDEWVDRDEDWGWDGYSDNSNGGRSYGEEIDDDGEGDY